MDGSIQYEISADSSKAVSASKATESAFKSLNQETSSNTKGLQDLAAKLDNYNAKQRDTAAGAKTTEAALQKLNAAHAEHATKAREMVGRLDALMGGKKAVAEATEQLTATTSGATAAAADLAGALGANKEAAAALGAEAVESAGKVGKMTGALGAVPAAAGAASGALAAIATVGAGIGGVLLSVKLLRDGADHLSKAEYVTDEQRQSLRGFVYQIDGVGRAVDKVLEKLGKMAAGAFAGTADFLSGGETRKAGETLQAADLVNERTRQMKELIALEEELKDRQMKIGQRLEDRRSKRGEIEKRIAAERAAPEAGVTEGPKQELEITRLETERARLNLEIYELEQQVAEQQAASKKKSAAGTSTTASSSDMLTGQIPADVYQSYRRDEEISAPPVRDERGHSAPRAADTDGNGLVSRGEAGRAGLASAGRERDGRIHGYTGGPRSMVDTLTGWDRFNARKAREAAFEQQPRAPRRGEAAPPRDSGDGGVLTQILAELRRIRTS